MVNYVAKDINKTITYRMFFEVISKIEPSLKANVSTISLRVLHERMGHLNINTIQEMIKKNVIKGIELSKTDVFFCEACQFGKAHRLKFSKHEEYHQRKPGEYIHSDVCGPFPESRAGLKYFITFIDDASNYRQVYFLKHKSDTIERFREFNNQLENKFGKSIKVLKVDDGREYCNDNMYRYMKVKGIQMDNTAPYTPEQNGKAERERENRTIVESVRTMLHAKNLPDSFWVEAVSTSIYILNSTISNKNTNVTSYEIWTGEKPDISHLRIFGSSAYVHIDKQFRKKLSRKVRK